MNRRAWLVGGMAIALVASAGYAYSRSRGECGASVTSLPASKSSSPFLDVDQRASQPDHDRDVLVSTLAGDPPPVGEVVGAVGYHYEQWAHVSAYAQGIRVRTRDNPDFTMLDDQTLLPRWSVAVTTKRSTYDASEKRYLVATMPRKAPPDLVALDADNGRRIWCASLDRVVSASDPFATQFLDGEDVAVLWPGPGSKEQIARLSDRDGEQLWRRTLDADSGDFLGDMGNGTLLAGGRAQFELADPASVGKRPEGVALALLSARDGSTIWARRAPAGTDVHVFGTDPASGMAVVQEGSARAGTTMLRAINSEGHEEWSAVPARGASFDATLRSGRVLVRAGNRWSALPTDGINTTYWPYELAVSERLIAVATNTGAVVVRRE